MAISTLFWTFVKEQYTFQTLFLKFYLAHFLPPVGGGIFFPLAIFFSRFSLQSCLSVGQNKYWNKIPFPHDLTISTKEKIPPFTDLKIGDTIIHTAGSDTIFSHIWLLVRYISLKFQKLWLKCGNIYFV